MTRMIKLTKQMVAQTSLRRVRESAGVFLRETKMKFSLFNKVKKFSNMMAKCKESMHSFQYGCSLLRQAVLDMFVETFAYVVNDSRPEFKSIPDLSRQRE